MVKYLKYQSFNLNLNLLFILQQTMSFYEWRINFLYTKSLDGAVTKIKKTDGSCGYFTALGKYAQLLT